MFCVTYCKKCLPDKYNIMAVTDRVDIQHTCADHPRKVIETLLDDGKIKRTPESIDDYTGAFMVTDEFGVVPGDEIKIELLDEIRTRYAKMFTP